MMHAPAAATQRRRSFSRLVLAARIRVCLPGVGRILQLRLLFGAFGCLMMPYCAASSSTQGGVMAGDVPSESANSRTF